VSIFNAEMFEQVIFLSKNDIIEVLANTKDKLKSDIRFAALCSNMIAMRNVELQATKKQFL